MLSNSRVLSDVPGCATRQGGETGLRWCAVRKLQSPLRCAVTQQHTHCWRSEDQSQARADKLSGQECDSTAAA